MFYFKSNESFHHRKPKMAKKSAKNEFNMTQVIREILTANPKLSFQAANDAIMAKYPTAKINKGSFSVAFYTGRQKLGIRKSRRGKKAGSVGMVKSSRPVAHTGVDLATLQTTAKFLSEVGGVEAALAAIKNVQGVQVK
jgi:hypothetical protein